MLKFLYAEHFGSVYKKASAKQRLFTARVFKNDLFLKVYVTALGKVGFARRRRFIAENFRGFRYDG